MAAGWYVRHVGHCDHDELMSEGMVALIGAAEGYEPWTSTARFGSYAGRAVFNRLREWVCKDRTVDVPKYIQDPTQVRMTGRSSPADRSAAPTSTATWPVPGRQDRPASLSACGDEDDTPTILPIDPGPSPLETLIAREDADRIRVALGRLPPLRSYIICHRFGLCGCEERNAQQLGRELDLTRERIRQIVVQSLAALGHILGLERDAELAAERRRSWAVSKSC